MEEMFWIYMRNSSQLKASPRSRVACRAHGHKVADQMMTMNSNCNVMNWYAMPHLTTWNVMYGMIALSWLINLKLTRRIRLFFGEYAETKGSWWAILGDVPNIGPKWRKVKWGTGEVLKQCWNLLHGQWYMLKSSILAEWRPLSLGPTTMSILICFTTWAQKFNLSAAMIWEHSLSVVHYHPSCANQLQLITL